MQHRHVTFDDSTLQVAEPLPLKKRRGRPFGSKSRTWIGSGKSFTTADFAFLRAHLLGVDIRHAAVRYLLHLDISTTREATAYFDALMARMESLAREDANIKDAARPTVEAAVDVILSWRRDVLKFAEAKTTAPAPAPAAAPAVDLPTLEEFMYSAKMEDFSETEVLEAYQETYGDQLALQAAPKAVVSAVPAPAATPEPSADPYSARRLASVADSIGRLLGMISVAPMGTDETIAWLPPALAEKFRPFGVLTLSDLANWININGRGWFSKVPAVGKSRAQRLAQWLNDNEKTVGVELNDLVKSSMAQEDVLGAAATDLAAPASTSVSQWQALEFGIVPVQHLDWPMRLRGHDGMFRSKDNNTLGATDDAHAISLWLAEHNDSPRTLEAYTRAVEWLVLWAVVEKGKAISSLVRADLQEFKTFLFAPPPHWVQTARVTKNSKHWRPLRGPLAESSVEGAMRAVSALFAALTKASYLRANAASGLVRTKRTEITMDTTRSLSNQDIEVVAAALASMDESPRKRRFRALLLLLQTTGLRRHELVALVWRDIKRARTDNNESDVWQVSFIGKGRKERTLPITQQTYQALSAHREDRKELAKGRKLAFLSQLKDDEWPLVGILDDAQAQEREAKASDFVYDTGRLANLTGALSTQRVHTIIKDFFKSCVAKAHELGRDSENFERASLHWMRHTFAHQVLAATSNDLAVTQQLLGHSSIAVTSIYVKANMQQRIDAVKKVNIGY